MNNKTISNIISKIKNSKFYFTRYRSQIKNSRNKYISCFPSTVSMFLSGYGVDITPDKIMRECNTNSKLWNGVNYWTRSRFKNKMFQVWQVEENLINFYLDKKVRQHYKLSLQSLIKIAKIKPVIVNTTPKYKGKKLGHIMEIAEATDTDFIINDSFGDFRVNYATGHNAKGNNLNISFKDFEKIRGRMSIYGK